jgi:hypothetical protein
LREGKNFLLSLRLAAWQPFSGMNVGRFLHTSVTAQIVIAE